MTGVRFTVPDDFPDDAGPHNAGAKNNRRCLHACMSANTHAPPILSYGILVMAH